MASLKESFIRHVIIEIRPLLRCCNFFIKTDKLTQLDTFEIKIRPDCVMFTLNEYSSEDSGQDDKIRGRYDSSSSCDTESEGEDNIYCKMIPTKQFFKLVPGSLSSLKLEDSLISFRVLTEPPSVLGSTFEEILSGSTISSQDTSYPEQTIRLELDKNTQLLCHNCKNVISKPDISFHRILQLPSENIDMSDWFCHDQNGHCHSSKKEAHKSIRKSFDPDNTDIFYKMCHFKVNSANFSDRFSIFNKNRNVLHCNRCLSWLGVKKDASFTMWNSSLLMSSDGNTELLNLFSYASPFNIQNMALNDFIYCVKKVINESIISKEIRPMPKILITCKISDKEEKHLLLWILDSQLDIIKSNNIEHKEGSYDLDLCAIKTTKLLYRLLDTGEDVDSEEASFFNVDMSKDMFTSGLMHLNTMSLYVPKSNRMSNGFHVTYLYF